MLFRSHISEINFIGYHFYDSIDCLIRSQNNENIYKIGETFSLMVSEIFYDGEKLKEFNMNLSLSGQNNSIEKEKVEQDGVIKIENFDLIDNNYKRIRGNIYVLSEKYQIFPLYTFTLRRNEYFVLYRDPNFIGRHNYTKELKNIKLKSLKYSYNKNFYFESSTEEALKLLLKKKNEKVILITSIRYDQSGIRFTQIARKILQSEYLIVLYIFNNTKYLEWVKNFPNCLFTRKFNIYEEYISNYIYP